MSVLVDVPALAIVPILPALPSLVVVLTLGGTAAVTAIWSLRRQQTRRLMAQFLWSQRWSLLTMSLLAAGAVVAWGWLRTESSAVVSASWQPGSWSHRGGLRRTGVIAGSPSPIDGHVQWSGGRGYSFLASPAVVGDRVYAVGFRGDQGRLFCWDARSGTQLWTRSPPQMRAAFSSPVISGEVLVVGEGLHRTIDASVYCFDLRPGHEGDVLWRFPTNSHVECTPVVAEGRVYIGAGEDGIYCLALDPAVRPQQRMIWHAPGEQYPDVETALVVYEGRVYAGTGVGGEDVVVLDAESGSEVVRFALPFPVYTPPAIADGTLYVGAGTGNFLHLETTRGLVTAIDLETHERLWTHDVPGTVLGAIVCDAQEVIFGCADGMLRVLDTNGKLLREWHSQGPIVAAPAVSADLIFIVNQSGMLYALNRHSLKPVWEARLGRSGLFSSSPLVAHGHIFVGTQNDDFVCIGESPATTLSLSDRPRVLWSQALAAEKLGRPVVTPDVVLVPTRDSSGGGIISIARSGDRASTNQLELSDDESDPLLSSEGNIAVTVDGRTLVAFDAPTTRPLWRVELQTDVAIDQLRIVGDVIGLRYDQAASQAAQWEFRSLVDGSTVGRDAPPADVEPRVIVVRGNRLMHRNGDGAETLWVDLSPLGTITTDVAIDGDCAYVGVGRSLVCLGSAISAPSVANGEAERP